ncbi:MAG: hypothetical protein K8R68_08350 [Bacteroidales bacterium]|nr:hypothetical protein [Bacteroidales bacterium]
MTKKLFIFFMIAGIFTACSNNQSGSADNNISGQEIEDDLVVLTVAEFDNKAGDYVNKKVQISGTVDRTCKHSGKRMFIVDGKSEGRVKIEAGNNISSFDAELEGSDVLVKGLVTELKVDEAYLNEWENEILMEINSDHKIHDGQHKAGEDEIEDYAKDMEKIENFRKKIAETGKDFLSFYSIECISFEVVSLTSEN